MLRVKHMVDQHGTVMIEDPPVARFLFSSTTAAWVWLVLRLYVGWQWLQAGWEKATSPAWMDGSGTAILGFWQRAVVVPEPPARAPIAFDWYRGFLEFLIQTNSQGWFSYMIVLGQLAVALGLITGTFVGIAAAGGLTMNMSFMLAGTASTNPLLAILGILLILAWKNAGYFGVDRYLLPMLGTPWRQPRLAPRGLAAPAPVGR